MRYATASGWTGPQAQVRRTYATVTLSAPGPIDSEVPSATTSGGLNSYTTRQPFTPSTPATTKGMVHPPTGAVAVPVTLAALVELCLFLGRVTDPRAADSP